MDHILPQAAIQEIPGFRSLPKDVQKQLLNDVSNFQPMVAPANCSKGCRVEGVNGGWLTWSGQPISPAYKKYLQDTQDASRAKVEKIVAAHRASKGG